jgi:polyferredoxin
MSKTILGCALLCPFSAWGELIRIAKKDSSQEVRKQAIFWLGQKDSDEALKFFEEILLKK